MEDILQIIQEGIMAGNPQTVINCTQEALTLGYSTNDIIEKAMLPPMKLMGEKLKNCEIFIPTVLMSARAMHAAMYVIKPLIDNFSGASNGLVVIGTVAGDLHDIGKNMVSMMLKGNGFTVIDLGIDVTKEKFLDAVKRYSPNVLALSALLTTTLPEIGNVVKYLEDNDMRNKVKITIGGAPVTQNYAKSIKADAYSKDMFEAVDAVLDLVHGVKGKYSTN